MPYSVTKAAGIHLMKCLATTQGPKIRVNAVLPGLMLTDWVCKCRELWHCARLTLQGLKNFSEERLKAMEEKAVLKKVTDLDDTADAFIMLAKNSSMTGMKVQVGELLHLLVGGALSLVLISPDGGYAPDSA